MVIKMDKKKKQKVFALMDLMVRMLTIWAAAKLFIFLFVTAICFWIYIITVPEFSHLANTISLFLKWMSYYILLFTIGITYVLLYWIFKKK